MKGTIAYCATPRAGGVFAHYRALREALTPRGWTVHAVSGGQAMSRLWQNDFPDEGCIRIADDTNDPHDVARAMADWCASENVDVLFLTAPDYSLPAWNAVRHISPSVRIVSRAYDTTPFSYRAVVIHPDRLSAVIATSQRQYDDLLGGGYVDTARLHLIPHTVRDAFLNAGSRRADRGPRETIRLGYAGRLNEAQKGIFLLPELGRCLSDLRIPWTLDVLGEGPDEQALARRCVKAGVEAHVRFHGRRSREEVAAHMAQWDVFIMPSRHEGFGIALIEAMAAGAVPVVHRIRGVTDWIVETGKTGWVVEQGDLTAMTDIIGRLHADHSLLRTVCTAAQQAVSERFHPDTMAQQYDALFEGLLREDPANEPLPWSAFRPARFPRSAMNRFIHAFVPRALRGRIGRWTHKVSS